MKLSKSFKHALNMVLHSRLRSWLTILGIVIGVGAVVAIMSLGQGLQEEVGSQLGRLGGDIVTVRAGASRAFGFGGFRGDFGGGGVATEEEVVLDRTDYQALRGLPEVKLIDREIRGEVEVYYLSKRGDVQLTGVDPAVWSQITTLETASGRLLGPSDTNVIVIGERLAEGFFDQPVGVNKMLTVEGSNYRVAGVLDGGGTDIYMPLQTAYLVLDDKERDVYDSLVIKIKDEDMLDESVAAIENKLMLVRHVTEDKKDFSVSSNAQQSEQRAEAMSSMTAFLTAIAAVALLVGAVGIANTMFTSVLEKTKDIGIMKAVGARNKDILTIFLLNAALIGLIGGVLGIVLGYLLSGMLPALMGTADGMFRRLGSSSVISMNSVILAIGISTLIGIIAGLIPAYQASKLKPVDALRYE